MLQRSITARKPRRLSKDRRGSAVVAFKTLDTDGVVGAFSLKILFLSKLWGKFLA